MTVPSTATHFPLHIYTEIAAYSDEKTIWRMMFVSRAMRQGAEIALRPYLSSKTLAADSLPLDLYKPIEPSSDLAVNDRPRRTALRAKSNLLARHLTSYSPFASLLRHLHVKHRDDENYAGWPYLRDLSPHLEILEIHLID